MLPTIVLSGHTTGLGVIRALGTMGVPVVAVCYENTDMGSVSRYVIERVAAPHPERHEEEFIALLEKGARKWGGSLIVPADDATLLVVSKNKALLQRHYTVACTEWEITERFIDKKHTYALADRIGIAAPRTLVPGSEEELREFAREIEYPCLVKPRQSHRYFEVFRRKMVRVENLAAMVAAYREAQGAGIDVMLQEYIPGDDRLGVNYNSYFWDDRPLIEFTARKVRLSPPKFGVPTVVRSSDVQEVIEPGRRILSALGYYGYSCTEFKRDPRDGRYKLLEVNGRHNRSALLSVACGLNFPWYEYRHLLYGELPEQGEYREGVYWIDELKDVVQMLAGGEGTKRDVGHFLEPYRGEHIYSVMSRTDFLPICKRVADLSLKAVRGILGVKGAAT